MEIALDQCGPATERRLALVDKNRDLYITSVRVFGGDRKSYKLGETCAILYISTPGLKRWLTVFKKKLSSVCTSWVFSFCTSEMLSTVLQEYI